MNKNKIEEASKKCLKDFDECGDRTQGFLVQYGFKEGAKWAIDEFLKDLWHPASEEPKMTNQENEFVECLVKFKDGIVCLYNYDTWHHWWCSDEGNQKFLGLIDKWLYIDDLLTKKGGE